MVGREESPVGVLGNHAGTSDCVLVIDQVDAVSEASGRAGRIRDLVFQMTREARYFPGLRVVIACRRYDLDNDSRLKELETGPQAMAVRLKPLHWASAVQPVLERLGLATRQFSERQKELLSVPINLHIFASLANAGEAPGNELTGVQLFDRLLELRARELRASGITWSIQTALGSLASWMSNNQVLVAPATVLAAFPGAVDLLSSQCLIAKAAGRVQFAHESFVDHVFSADFVARGGGVLALLKSDQQRLFRRTQVRQIFARLRDQGGPPYLDNLREVMNSPDVRYLVKDAVAAWLGRLSPAATRRLSELERKFAGRPLPEAFGVRGGWVRSPVKPEKAALMSDSQWLRAVRRYTGDERHIYESDGIVGGAEQLAHVLQSRVKEQPERFVQLLERLPADTNPAYASAVLSGLRESACKDGATVGLRAIRAATRWGRSRFRREMCWLVQKWPDIGRDPDVFADLLAIATDGEASDTAVRFAGPRERSRIQDLLRGSEELETSAINGDRGVAWRALAAVLWIEQTAIESVVVLLEERMDSELTSVRMSMLEAVNAVVKHDVGRGLSLLERFARRDLVAVHSASGRHVLQWAAYNHTLAVQPILDRLADSDDESLRALGLTLEAVLALNDDSKEPGFTALFAGDSLRRRVAGFVAAENLTSGTVSERAGRWLSLLFEDPEPEVRAEAALVDWAHALEDTNRRIDLASAFVRSAAFADDPERLMWAIEERVDRFPTLALEAVSRVLGLEEEWATEGRQRHSLAVHNLGKVLIALYRTVESDRAVEDRILNLVDNYLASDLRYLGEEIRAYERH